jgi:hypothetical protein
MWHPEGRTRRRYRRRPRRADRPSASRRRPSHRRRTASGPGRRVACTGRRTTMHGRGAGHHGVQIFGAAVPTLGEPAVRCARRGAAPAHCTAHRSRACRPRRTCLCSGTLDPRSASRHATVRCDRNDLVARGGILATGDAAGRGDDTLPQIPAASVGKNAAGRGAPVDRWQWPTRRTLDDLHLPHRLASFCSIAL